MAWKRPHRGNLGPRQVGILSHQHLWHLGTKTRSVLPCLRTPALMGPQSRWVRSSTPGWSWPNAIIYTQGSQRRLKPRALLGQGGSSLDGGGVSLLPVPGARA